jgi:hypothetical protein
MRKTPRVRGSSCTYRAHTIYCNYLISIIYNYSGIAAYVHIAHTKHKHTTYVWLIMADDAAISAIAA